MQASEISHALSFVSADDRSLWVAMAMAVKSELGEAGYAIWDVWSRGSEKYRASSALSVWRSVNGGGAVGIGSLFHAAKMGGWQRGTAVREPIKAKPAILLAMEERPTAKAKDEIWGIKARAAQSTHPYLEAKGFPEKRMLTCDGNLIVPMMLISGYCEVVCIQTITPGGQKKFTPGGRASGAVFTLGGDSTEQWWVEGLATGLSVRAALARLSRRSQVVVCFSAHNLAAMAEWNGASLAKIVADHDENGVGEKAARKTGLPWWMPPEIGDANDYHLAHGINALASQLRGVK